MYFRLISYLILLVLFQSFNPTLYAQTIIDKDLESRIQTVENNLVSWVVIGADSSKSIEERMKFYGVKGLSIAIIDDFKIDWAKGYGIADDEENRRVTSNTLFQAASISKSLNTTGLLKLYQEGKINLNEDINTYLTSWKFPYDSKFGNKTINLAEILSHTAGLSVHGFGGYKKEQKLPTIVQMLDGIKPATSAPVRSIFEPGLKFQYSGGGFLISQLLLMDVTKQSYEEYMQKNILEPLEMSNSSYVILPTVEMQKVIATGYYENGKEVKGKYHVLPELAPAGLWTTPTDLCKYIIESQLSYLGRSNKILTQEFAQLRMKPFRENIEKDCDLIMGGFVLKGEKESYFFHSGGNEGYTALYFGSLNTGKGVAMMCNSNGSIRILKEIANSVAKTYNWIDFPLLPIEKNIISIPESLLNNYVGNYRFNGNKCKIIKKGNNLYVKFDGDLYKMFFTSPYEFFVIEQWQKEYKMLVNKEEKFTGEIIYK